MTLRGSVRARYNLTAQPDEFVNLLMPSLFMAADRYWYLIAATRQATPYSRISASTLSRSEPIFTHSGIAVWGGTTTDDVAIAELQLVPEKMLRAGGIAGFDSAVA
jgi:hypothetical protein